MQPVSGKVLVEAYLPSKARADEVKARSGILIATNHDKKSSFEGVPNQGYIYALADDYAGPLKAGDRVIFSEKSPQGFEWDDKTLFALDLEQIVARVQE